jgi:hypothetical protein
MPPTEGRDALVERLFDAAENVLNHIEDVDPGATYQEVIVDAILAEIEAAGYRIVSADASCFEPVTDEVLMPGFDPDAYDLEAEQ